MKKIYSILLLLNLSCFIFAFDWPQEEVVQADQFYSYFGQLRGDTVSNSLIFSEPSEIKAADNGKVIIFVKDYSDQTDFFPSTLGNAVIIEHEDKLLTVYANIDSESVTKDIFTETSIQSGHKLGISGNSAWQQGRSSLEFQVIDTKDNTSINPRLLMPRVGKELPLYYNDIYLQDKLGRNFNVKTNNTLPKGIYRIYKKRQSVAVPYKTTVAINGAIEDSISYDLLRQDDGQICVSGKKNYPKNILYPNNDLILLGEANLSKGKVALQLTLFDILGKESPTTYFISVY